MLYGEIIMSESDKYNCIGTEETKTLKQWEDSFKKTSHGDLRGFDDFKRFHLVLVKTKGKITKDTKDTNEIKINEIKISRVRIVESKNGRDGGENDVLATFPKNEGSGITIEKDCRVDVEIGGKWHKIWEIRISSKFQRCDIECDV